MGDETTTGKTRTTLQGTDVSAQPPARASSTAPGGLMTLDSPTQGAARRARKMRAAQRALGTARVAANLASAGTVTAEGISAEDLRNRIRQLREDALVRFQDALDKASEADVHRAGELVLAVWLTIEYAYDAVLRAGAPPAPAGPVQQVPATPPVATEVEEAYQGARRAVLTRLSTQAFRGRALLGELQAATVEGDFAQFVADQTAAVATVVKDTSELVGLLKRGDLPENEQWKAVGLLRQHQNPWHFAYMRAVVADSGLEGRFAAFAPGPAASLRQLIEAHGQIRAARLVGPSEPLGLFAFLPAEGKVRLLQPVSGRQLAGELYGKAEAWETLLIPYNRGKLTGAGADAWLPVGTELLVDPERLVAEFRALGLAVRAARLELRAAGYEPYILAQPQAVAVPGTSLSYTVVWPNSMFENAQLEWWVENDPITAREHGISPHVRGPRGRLSWVHVYSEHATWKLNAVAPGNHLIKCRLALANRPPRELSYTQTVMTLQEKTSIDFARDLDWTRSPATLLKQLQDHLNQIPDTEEHKEEREQITQQIRSLEGARREMGPANMRAVKAVWVSATEQPVTIPLTIYVGSDPEYNVGVDQAYYLKLWDFTLRGKPRQYYASADRVMDALDELLETFADDAPYPTGNIRFQTDAFTLTYHGVHGITETYPTDGGSALSEILGALSFVTLAVGTAAALLLQPEIAVPAFYVSGLLGGAAGAANLADRIEHGQFEWDAQTGLDLFAIAGALVTGGVSGATTATARGVGKITLVSRLPAAMGYAELALTVGVHLSQIRDAVRSGDRDRVAQALVQALADGAVILVVHQAGKRLQRLTTATTEPHAPLRPPAPAETSRTGAGTAGPPAGPSPASIPEAPEALPRYVKPGTPEYYRLLHEGWSESMLRNRMVPGAVSSAPVGPELREGTVAVVDHTRVQDAFRAYEDALTRAGGREVGLYRNIDTGTYAVQVGTESSVAAPPKGRWEAVVHYHQNPRNVLNYRMPAPADVEGAADAAMRAGRPITEFVDYPMPGIGKGRVAYTIRPGRPMKIVVEYIRPGGEPVRRTFGSLKDYRAAYGARTHYVDPDSPEYRWIRQDLDDFYRYREPSPVKGGEERTAAGVGRGPTPAGGNVAPTPRIREEDVTTGPHGPDRRLTDVIARALQRDPATGMLKGPQGRWLSRAKAEEAVANLDVDQMVPGQAYSVPLQEGAGEVVRPYTEYPVTATPASQRIMQESADRAVVILIRGEIHSYPIGPDHPAYSTPAPMR
jgi:hypothetical protein